MRLIIPGPVLDHCVSLKKVFTLLDVQWAKSADYQV